MHRQLPEEAHHIERSFRFRNFREALTFVQEIGELAEAAGLAGLTRTLRRRARCVAARQRLDPSFLMGADANAPSQ
jgi:hypothetical protein